MATDACLLDTNIASAAWDGGHKHHHVVREGLSSLGDESVWICVISLGEVEYGLQVSPAIDHERQQGVRNAMQQYQVWGIDEETAMIWARLRGELFQRHAPRNAKGRISKKRPEELTDRTTGQQLGIQENDLWIVSVAIQYNLQFITSDKMERILEVALEVEGYDRAIHWPLDGSPLPVNHNSPPAPQ